MAFLGPVAGVLSSLVGVAGTIVSGVAAANQAKYQQKIADMNAQIANDNARRAVDRSAVEAQDQDAQTKAMLGAQESAQAASGLSLDSKSFIRTRKAARELGRRDTLNTIQAGNIEAYNYKTQAANQTAQGQLYGMEAKSDLLGTFLAGTGNLLGDAASVKNPNMFGGSNYEPFKRRATWRTGL